MQQGVVVGVSISENRGTSKKNIGKGYLKEGYGLVGDAHAGTERAVSILTLEEIEKAVSEKKIEVSPGDFAENITIKGIAPEDISLGSRFIIGEAEVEVIQIGKEIDENHTFSFHGMVLLATKGCFCKVIRSGWVQTGDQVKYYPYNLINYESGSENAQTTKAT